ncbi:hypothetical protein [Cerasicoccus arenae]|uniref:Uncharacterized protein n=1 Tax=Cerasicoccus arenae TaxID=424488 RepID=A0A8J3DJF3_9BACT|nr:hypothetical protein [Cerasicoccus arenae]MBK1857219.1 hypothetical protein [Cerasicoccus arenae]GHC00074.1 hypothetical protein GCM10007047_15390 [Cerasicoccus arenae]
MSDSNPDKPTPESDKERLAKIAASLPGEVVSREAAFPKKRQRPKARLPESVRAKIETEATEEAAKDKESDGPKAPAEKPKFKVTRSPFAPRIDQVAKSTSPMGDSWGDEEEADEPKSASKPQPEVAKKAEPAVEKKPEPIVQKKAEPEAAKPELKPLPRPMPTKLEVTRAPIKPEAQDEPKPTAAKKEGTKLTPLGAPAQLTPAAKKEEATKPAPVVEKPAAKSAEPVKLPTTVKQAGPTKLPVAVQPAAKKVEPVAGSQKPTPLPSPSSPKLSGGPSRTAPRPKAAPAPGRQVVVEEETESVSIIWVAFDAVAAVASLAFAALVFMNMGG